MLTYANGMPVINDSTPTTVTHDPKHGRGLELIEPAPRGSRYGGLAVPFPRELLIPRSDWLPIIRERKQRKLTNRDRLDFYGVQEKNQKQTLFCWSYGVVQCCEGARAFANQGYVPLSAASVASVINNFRNNGGYGPNAIKFIAERGCQTEETWPNATIDRRYNTEANWQKALDYRVTEWWEITTEEERVSLALRGGLSSGGYNWWRHQIMIADVDELDGEIVDVIRNQWQGWGDRNYGILQGRRREPDDCVAPAVLIAA